MASRALAAAARGPEDYARVYDRILSQVAEPVIVHWLGEMFDPALAGYWGHDDHREAMEVCLSVIEANAAKVDGIKISLLDKDKEIALRRRLPEGVRMYTGDDFNYPELIEGDEEGYSDALLGIFDAIAPAASAALGALSGNRTEDFRTILAPTVELSRHIFRAPTRFYKTGVVFMAYLTGLQDHFVMVGGQQSARSVRPPRGDLPPGRPRGPPARYGARGGQDAGHDADARDRRLMPALEKLAINQATTRDQWTLHEAIEGYARHGVRGICVWRDKLAECGVGEAAKLLGDHGMTVTGLCRGGMFGGADASTWRATIDDNLRAIEEAAAIGARVLIMLAGGLPEGSKDLPGARARVAEGIAEILPAARAAGVPLAIEPLHPMTCADRGCVTTLKLANDLCDSLGEGVGVAVDVYHVWWDPALEEEIARAGDRILAFHVNDWLADTRDLVFDRGMMGDGVVDIPRIRGLVERAGYDGMNEVEIFSAGNWWKRDPDEVVAVCIERHETAV